MVTVKFIVQLFFIASCAAYSKYCKICSNHILCQFPTPGPGVSCKEYDRNKFLTDDDIYELVNQINERRNFIALGHSRHLPSAANMKKLAWSEELATFAQRWVDQCDPTLRPDKEDECRDLENTKVGQSIASIINPSPEFSVKSFIEMWFMQLLDYKGSVTYYDQFQDHISHYFTQLIWADTENVGCGRAKFNVHNVTVDRIVCNFSPKGNIHEKPIYSIGYPRTQCENRMAPDVKFKGLCTQPWRQKAKLTAANLPVSSLLKILNLSNDSVKQEIDPIYNNMKQITPHRNEMERPKHPIMRHIFGNKLQSRRPDYFHSQGLNFWESPVNFSRDYKDHSHHSNNHDKGHQRQDLSHISKYTDQTTKSNRRNDFRKNVMRTDVYNNYGNINNIKQQCTRNTQPHEGDCENNSKANVIQKCTRGLNTNCQILQSTKIPVTNVVQNDLCPCSTAYPSTNTQRTHTLNCDCLNGNGLTIRCPNVLRTREDNAYNRAAALEGDILLKDTSSYLNPEDEYEWLFNKRRKNVPRNKRSSYTQSIRNRYERDFGYSSSFKPFWQIDGFSNDRNPQFKALRYTTLHNKRRRKTNKKYTSKHFTTEPITIKLKNINKNPVTEKYLSFDELLHLRKFNLSTNNAKRRMEPQILRNPEENTTTTATSAETTTQATEEFTTNYTANSPFVRMKHCTRKLTCTWTAASMTDINGSVVGQLERGSRTPPGYVEGCTRTSTCTRDFMNRNKFPTTTPGPTNEDGNDDDDDNNNNNSDYCERRSLNLRKPNSHKQQKRDVSKMIPKKFANTSILRLSYSQGLSNHKTLNKKHFKKKRSLIKRKCPQSSLSYGDLYYMVLSKIVKQWKNNRLHEDPCPCNRVSETESYINIILLMFSSIFILF